MSTEMDSARGLEQLQADGQSLRCAQEILHLCRRTYDHKHSKISLKNGYPVARLPLGRAGAQTLVAIDKSKEAFDDGSIIRYVSLAIEEADGSSMSFTAEHRVLPYLGLHDDAFAQHILGYFRRVYN